MQRRLLPVLLAALLPGSAVATELAEFTIREPLGRNWTDEWLTHEVTVEPPGGELTASSLQVETQEGQALAAQFYLAESGRCLKLSETLTTETRLQVLFKASVKKNQTAVFRVTDRAKRTRPWQAVEISRRGGRTVVENGAYRVVFRDKSLLPIDEITAAGDETNLAPFAWPKDAEPAAVKQEWAERGPARAVLKRTFSFESPDRRYELTLDFRAGDPWLGVADTYALGRGSFITIDLRRLDADVVYHPHTYSARTFKPGGKAEDTTLEPPQHPIATLGPVWRDIWFGGGPFAFVYRQGADYGVGFAAVRGSQWQAPEGISLESQNLEVHGDRERPGQVWVKVPTDGGHRLWAIVVGPPEIRKEMGRMVRSRADVPLDVVLHEWVLDWESDAPEHSYGFAGQWLGYFNRHMLNPTTFPRRVRSHLNKLLKQQKEVKSRDLAVLAYVFTDPDYWPGPKYKWQIGNPNFHTDMYNVPLKIGLLMPDHPHAQRWVHYGVEETRGNLMRDSFPGGAWAESLSYAGFFFHVVENARMLREAGVCTPFRDWRRFKEVATYLACMHTPVDPRYSERQKAPIGDTHPGNYVEELNQMGELYRGIDDVFARQLARFPEPWDGALDISSREFFGFGAMLRGNPYDDRHESFVAIKAGPARNHFQGDELAFHFCSLATPLAIDHACHYSPRPWSASMHNRPDMDGKRPVAIAVRRAFAASDEADVFVADERTRRISLLPLEPHNTTKPGWEYPVVTLPEDEPWTMRRYVLLVKHDPERSRIPDYVVVRDEIDSPQPVWWNLHVLARDIRQEGQRFLFPGQLDVDLTVHVLEPAIRRTERRQWGWSRERKRGTRKGLKGEAYEKEHFGHYVPEDFQRGTWGESFEHSGEMTHWLRLQGDAGRSRWLVLLVPHRRGRPAPTIEKLSPTRARVSLGEESEIVHLGSEGKYQAAVERDGRTTTLLEPGRVKPWSELEFKPIPPDIDKGAL
ncbi:MAG: hypothetical protein ACLF0G_01015 [Candidatus Brocadiia bacterium]